MTAPFSPAADTVVPFGLDAVLVSVADVPAAQRTAAHLRAILEDRAVAVVPAEDSVLVHAATGTDLNRLIEAVTAALAEVPDQAGQGREHVLPVTYDGADLAGVADLLGLSIEEVISRHTGAVYEVAFLGFAPGFPYLTGLDPVLTVPRLDTPRSRVPAGSVGLAAGKTCVYPTVSPGGWRLLGRTATTLFDPDRERPALLAPGDTVRFIADRAQVALR